MKVGSRLGVESRHHSAEHHTTPGSSKTTAGSGPCAPPTVKHRDQARGTGIRTIASYCDAPPFESTSTASVTVSFDNMDTLPDHPRQLHALFWGNWGWAAHSETVPDLGRTVAKLRRHLHTLG